MEQFSYIFTIFFITIGPLKIIPLFYGMTIELDEKSLKKLAMKGTWFSLIIILLLALVVTHMLKAWRISIPSVTVAGSILLFISSLKMILAFKPPGAGAKHAAESDENKPHSLSPKELSMMALSPLAIPLIISPIGVAAIIAGASLALENGIEADLTVVGALLLIVFLNVLSMLFARKIMKVVSVPAFSIIGWIFAILQAALAVQFMVNALHKLFP
ncbi:MAG: MarC family protein [Sporocytophaga sp.]|uniref:MarC family protein n=1 Tax=Sporocytophaga sp. TaxID=2231183 RepID=UPI001B2EEA14|nr:MarC family protein [Sporocytophaga sp.]MBO9698696.1 MarC family protein [Sporocytophaga sp.]